MYDVFYRFYPYKLFLAKEGQSAVEDILGTFSVLENAGERERAVKSEISFAGKVDNLLEIGIKRDNAKTCFHVSYQHYLSEFAIVCVIDPCRLINISCA